MSGNVGMLVWRREGDNGAVRTADGFGDCVEAMVGCCVILEC